MTASAFHLTCALVQCASRFAFVQKSNHKRIVQPWHVGRLGMNSCIKGWCNSGPTEKVNCWATYFLTKDDLRQSHSRSDVNDASLIMEI
jgi:hypothetical protein